MWWYQGLKKQLTADHKQWTDDRSAWVSAVVAACTFVITAVVIAPLLKRRCDSRFDRFVQLIPVDLMEKMMAAATRFLYFPHHSESATMLNS